MATKPTSPIVTNGIADDWAETLVTGVSVGVVATVLVATTEFGLEGGAAAVTVAAVTVAAVIGDAPTEVDSAGTWVAPGAATTVGAGVSIGAGAADGTAVAVGC